MTAKAEVKKPAPVKKTKVLSAEEEAVVAAKKKAAVAKAEADKLVKKAEADAAKLKKKAIADKKKEAIAASHEKAKQAALKRLGGDAKEINVRMDKAAKLAADADDHRLAAAIRMDNAKEDCRDNGINFKDWAEEHIKLSHESIRKLLPIGTAENDKAGAGKLLLADMRNKNKAANQKSRDTARAERTATPVADTPATRKASAHERATEALDSMKADERKNFVKSRAEVAGLKVVDKADAAKPADERTPRERAEDAFNAMGAKAKVAFANWVAEEVGADLTMDGADGGLDALPAGADRR